MKVFTPDPCTPYRLCSFSSSRGCSIRGAEEVLIDVGMAKAESGVNFSEYLEFVKKVWEKISAKLIIVVPDTMGNWKLTYRNYLRYSRELRRFGSLAYVAQEFVLPQDVDADVVALPARRQGPYECRQHPLFCAFNVKWFVEERYDRGAPIHLLGPAKLELHFLKMWGTLQRIASLDTTAHHLKPSGDAGRVSGGKYMAEKGYVCQWLKEWLRGIV
jgi:hypothetical protein